MRCVRLVSGNMDPKSRGCFLSRRFGPRGRIASIRSKKKTFLFDRHISHKLNNIHAPCRQAKIGCDLNLRPKNHSFVMIKRAPYEEYTPRMIHELPGQNYDDQYSDDGWSNIPSPAPAVSNQDALRYIPPCHEQNTQILPAQDALIESIPPSHVQNPQILPAQLDNFSDDGWEDFAKNTDTMASPPIHSVQSTSGYHESLAELPQSNITHEDEGARQIHDNTTENKDTDQCGKVEMVGETQNNGRKEKKTDDLDSISDDGWEDYAKDPPSAASSTNLSNSGNISMISPTAHYSVQSTTDYQDSCSQLSQSIVHEEEGAKQIDDKKVIENKDTYEFTKMEMTEELQSDAKKEERTDNEEATKQKEDIKTNENVDLEECAMTEMFEAIQKDKKHEKAVKTYEYSDDDGWGGHEEQVTNTKFSQKNCRSPQTLSLASVPRSFSRKIVTETDLQFSTVISESYNNAVACCQSSTSSNDRTSQKNGGVTESANNSDTSTSTTVDSTKVETGKLSSSTELNLQQQTLIFPTFEAEAEHEFTDDTQLRMALAISADEEKRHDRQFVEDAMINYQLQIAILGSIEKVDNEKDVCQNDVKDVELDLLKSPHVQDNEKFDDNEENLSSRQSDASTYSLKDPFKNGNPFNRRFKKYGMSLINDDDSYVDFADDNRRILTSSEEDLPRIPAIYRDGDKIVEHKMTPTDLLCFRGDVKSVVSKNVAKKDFSQCSFDQFLIDQEKERQKQHEIEMRKRREEKLRRLKELSSEEDSDYDDPLFLNHHLPVPQRHTQQQHHQQNPNPITKERPVILSNPSVPLHAPKTNLKLPPGYLSLFKPKAIPVETSVAGASTSENHPVIVKGPSTLSANLMQFLVPIDNSSSGFDASSSSSISSRRANKEFVKDTCQLPLVSTSMRLQSLRPVTTLSRKVPTLPNPPIFKPLKSLNMDAAQPQATTILNVVRDKSDQEIVESRVLPIVDKATDNTENANELNNDDIDFATQENIRCLNVKKFSKMAKLRSKLSLDDDIVSLRLINSHTSYDVLPGDLRNARSHLLKGGSYDKLNKKIAFKSTSAPITRNFEDLDLPYLERKFNEEFIPSRSSNADDANNSVVLLSNFHDSDVTSEDSDFKEDPPVVHKGVFDQFLASKCDWNHAVVIETLDANVGIEMRVFTRRQNVISVFIDEFDSTKFNKQKLFKYRYDEDGNILYKCVGKELSSRLHIRKRFSFRSLGVCAFLNKDVLKSYTIQFNSKTNKPSEGILQYWPVWIEHIGYIYVEISHANYMGSKTIQNPFAPLSLMWCHVEAQFLAEGKQLGEFKIVAVEYIDKSTQEIIRPPYETMRLTDLKVTHYDPYSNCYIFVSRSNPNYTLTAEVSKCDEEIENFVPNESSVETEYPRLHGVFVPCPIDINIANRYIGLAVGTKDWMNSKSKDAQYNWIAKNNLDERRNVALGGIARNKKN